MSSSFGNFAPSDWINEWTQEYSQLAESDDGEGGSYEPPVLPAIEEKPDIEIKVDEEDLIFTEDMETELTKLFTYKPDNLVHMLEHQGEMIPDLFIHPIHEWDLAEFVATYNELVAFCAREEVSAEHPLKGKLKLFGNIADKLIDLLNVDALEDAVILAGVNDKQIVAKLFDKVETCFNKVPLDSETNVFAIYADMLSVVSPSILKSEALGGMLEDLTKRLNAKTTFDYKDADAVGLLNAIERVVAVMVEANLSGLKDEIKDGFKASTERFTSFITDAPRDIVELVALIDEGLKRVEGDLTSSIQQFKNRVAIGGQIASGLLHASFNLSCLASVGKSVYSLVKTFDFNNDWYESCQILRTIADDSEPMNSFRALIERDGMAVFYKNKTFAYFAVEALHNIIKNGLKRQQIAYFLKEDNGGVIEEKKVVPQEVQTAQELYPSEVAALDYLFTIATDETWYDDSAFKGFVGNLLRHYQSDSSLSSLLKQYAKKLCDTVIEREGPVSQGCFTRGAQVLLRKTLPVGDELPPDFDKHVVSRRKSPKSLFKKACCSVIADAAVFTKIKKTNKKQKRNPPDDVQYLYMLPKAAESAEEFKETESCELKSFADHFNKFLMSCQKLLIVHGNGAKTSAKMASFYLGKQQGFHSVCVSLSAISVKEQTKGIKKHIQRAYDLTSQELSVFWQDPNAVLIVNDWDVTTSVKLEELLKTFAGKVVITTRTEDSQHSLDVPRNFVARTNDVFIGHLTDEQITEYIKRWVAFSNKYSREHYNEAQLIEFVAKVRQTPGVNELIGVPEVLSLCLRYSRLLLEDGKSFDYLTLFETFILELFKEIEDKDEVKTRIRDVSLDISNTLLNVTGEFARLLLHAQARTITIPKKTLSSTGESIWPEDVDDRLKAFFDNPDETLRFLVYNNPLFQITDDTAGFRRRTYFEFFVAKLIIKELERLKELGGGKIQPDSVLNDGLLNNFSDAIKMVASHLQSDEGSDLVPVLKDALRATRDRDDMDIMGSNAVTLLNAARVSLANQDFSRIRAPDAVGEYLFAPHANFSKAVLTNIKLHDAIIYDADFTGADLTNADVGQLPSFDNTPGLTTTQLVMSRDGKSLAARCGAGHVYQSVHNYNVRIYGMDYSAPLDFAIESPTICRSIKDNGFMAFGADGRIFNFVESEQKFQQVGQVDMLPKDPAKPAVLKDKEEIFKAAKSMCLFKNRYILSIKSGEKKENVGEITDFSSEQAIAQQLIDLDRDFTKTDILTLKLNSEHPGYKKQFEFTGTKDVRAIAQKIKDIIDEKNETYVLQCIAKNGQETNVVLDNPGDVQSIICYLKQIDSTINSIILERQKIEGEEEILVKALKADGDVARTIRLSGANDIGVIFGYVRSIVLDETNKRYLLKRETPKGDFVVRAVEADEGDSDFRLLEHEFELAFGEIALNFAKNRLILASEQRLQEVNLSDFTKKRTIDLEIEGNITNIAYSADGKWCATAVANIVGGNEVNRIYVWQIDDAGNYLQKRIFKSAANALAFSADDRYLLYGGGKDNCLMQVRDVANGRLIKRVSTGCPNSTFELQKTVDGEVLYVATNKRVEVRPLALDKRVMEDPVRDDFLACSHMSWNKENQILTLAADDCHVWVKELDSGRLYRLEPRFANAVYQTHISADGQYIIGSDSVQWDAGHKNQLGIWKKSKDGWESVGIFDLKDYFPVKKQDESSASSISLSGSKKRVQCNISWQGANIFIQNALGKHVLVNPASGKIMPESQEDAKVEDLLEVVLPAVRLEDNAVIVPGSSGETDKKIEFEGSCVKHFAHISGVVVVGLELKKELATNEGVLEEKQVDCSDIKSTQNQEEIRKLRIVGLDATTGEQKWQVKFETNQHFPWFGNTPNDRFCYFVDRFNKLTFVEIATGKSFYLRSGPVNTVGAIDFKGHHCIVVGSSCMEYDLENAAEGGRARLINSTHYKLFVQGAKFSAGGLSDSLSRFLAQRGAQVEKSLDVEPGLSEEAIMPSKATIMFDELMERGMTKDAANAFIGAFCLASGCDASTQTGIESSNDLGDGRQAEASGRCNPSQKMLGW